MSDGGLTESRKRELFYIDKAIKYAPCMYYFVKALHTYYSDEEQEYYKSKMRCRVHILPNNVLVCSKWMVTDDVPTIKLEIDETYVKYQERDVMHYLFVLPTGVTFELKVAADKLTVIRNISHDANVLYDATITDEQARDLYTLWNTERSINHIHIQPRYNIFPMVEIYDMWKTHPHSINVTFE